jgi:hypothetical protein
VARMTAYDAYWLGLVDEVVGAKLLSWRTFVEFKPDPQPQPQPPGLPEPQPQEPQPAPAGPAAPPLTD